MAVGMLRRPGDSLLCIISGILDLSKIGAGKLALERIDFDLRQAVDDIVSLLAEGARRKGLQFSLQMSDDLPLSVCGDLEQLRPILTNLINNAIKFTERGAIAVEVRRDGDDCVRLAVSDTDVGIATEAA